MNKFQELFKKSNNEPITYKGKKLYLVDYIDLNKDDVLIVKIVSVGANRTQIFSVRIDDPKRRKYLEVNGKNVWGIPFHESVMPKDGVKITVIKDNVRLTIENRGAPIWGWPMIVEKKENKRIYYCNADDQEERFDDLVFQIEIIKAEN